VTKFRNFGTPPYNFGTNRDICFKFDTDIDDGPLLRPDHKMTRKWAWPGSRDRILHSKDEYYCLPASWCYIKGKWYVY